MLNTFKEKYITSGEERRDVLAAYTTSKGNMNRIFKNVMMSNPLDDEERYREIIDTAIAQGEVESYNAYTDEPARKKKERMDKATRESKEAEAYAKELGVEEKLFGSGGGKKGKGKGTKDSDGGLAALIQRRQKGRAEEFFEKLESKYNGGAEKTRKSKKRGLENEPPKEAFRQTAERAEKAKTVRQAGGRKSRTQVVEDEDDEDGEAGAETVRKSESKSKSRGESNGTRKSKRVKT